MKSKEQIATVIDLTNQLEDTMEMIFGSLVTPHEKYRFLRDAIFHNTCISFGMKVRLLKIIADTMKWKAINLGPFDDLLALRNAFAHTSTDKKQFTIFLDQSTNKPTKFAQEMVIEKKHKNSWEPIDRDMAYDKFNELHKKCANTLHTVMQNIEKDTGTRFIIAITSLTNE